jgi:RNA polymerase sigma factor (sigma-70 family)
MRTASLNSVVAYVRQLTQREARRSSESELIQSFTGAHDEAAFAEIVRLHGPMVLATCRRVLRHTQDAEDAFQATFLVLARKAASIRTSESLGGWLHQVAFRLALRARSNKERKRTRQVAVEFAQVESFEPSRQCLRDALDEELQRLPDAYRSAIVLCYLEGRTQIEAARLLATTSDAVNSRLKRGRKLLRQRLARGGLILSASALVHGLTAEAANAALAGTAIQALSRTAIHFAFNSGSLSGVSARAALLAKGGLSTMIPAKLKIASALLLAVVALSVGARLAPPTAAGKNPPLVDEAPFLAQGPKEEGPKGKKKQQLGCIILWLEGGPSQTDTFDPKAGDIAIFKAIDTNIKGVQFTEIFPLLAKQANHLAVIRSMTHRTGDHQRGAYLMHTGQEPGPNAEFPSLGSVLAKELSGDRPDLPRFFRIGGPHPFGESGPGLLGKEYSAIGVGRTGMNLSLPPEDAFEEVAKGKGKKLRDAVAKAFDLNEEKDAVRDAYGHGRFGSSCLLARRLIERGVPVVEVALGGWDTHGNAKEATKRVGSELDAALASLLKDLHERKKLDTTLIVCMGEFGRTPVINANGGRDHYPLAFTTLLAGRGIKGGQAIGKTSKDAVKVDERPVTPQEFLATIYQALDIDPAKTNRDSAGAAIPLVEKGNLPVKEALR